MERARAHDPTVGFDVRRPAHPCHRTVRAGAQRRRDVRAVREVAARAIGDRGRGVGAQQPAARCADGRSPQPGERGTHGDVRRPARRERPAAPRQLRRVRAAHVRHRHRHLGRMGLAADHGSVAGIDLRDVLSRWHAPALDHAGHIGAVDEPRVVAPLVGTGRGQRSHHGRRAVRRLADRTRDAAGWSPAGGRTDLQSRLRGCTRLAVRLCPVPFLASKRCAARSSSGRQYGCHLSPSRSASQKQR